MWRDETDDPKGAIDYSNLCLPLVVCDKQGQGGRNDCASETVQSWKDTIHTHLKLIKFLYLEYNFLLHQEHIFHFRESENIPDFDKHNKWQCSLLQYNLRYPSVYKYNWSSIVLTHKYEGAIPQEIYFFFASSITPIKSHDIVWCEWFWAWNKLWALAIFGCKTHTTWQVNFLWNSPRLFASITVKSVRVKLRPVLRSQLQTT